MPTLAADELCDFASQLLHAGGVSQEESQLIAKSLVGANLRGHDSHGVMRIPQYLQFAEQGDAIPGAEFTVLKETDSLLLADGHWGFGQTQAQRLTRRLIEKASSSGVAVGTLIHSTHVGRMGEYCEMAADANLVSMIMANTHGFARRVAPPGGTAPRLGTNPLAIGVPHGGSPLVVDFGTSATAEGKVRVKKIAGESCPDGWILDSKGEPTNDPNDLYADPPGSILPMGGPQAYKGFALGLMIEIFAGALSGGPCIREVPENQNGNCVFMQFINPAAMGGAEHFANEVQGLIEFVRGCPRKDGVDAITLPGDPERNVLAARSAGGIAIDQGNWDVLVELGEGLNVVAPTV